LIEQRLVLVGANHKSAPIWLREKLHCDFGQISDRLNAITRNGSGIREGVILSTCNRFELYVIADGNENGQSLLTMLSDWGRTPKNELERHVYTLFDAAAASHLFAVASGLDSLILGEQQIQLQVRDAIRIAKRAGTSGSILSELFQSADRSATRIRTESGIGLSGTSVSSAAILLLTSKYPTINSILVVGAGRMMSLAADQLNLVKKREILVANRTPQRSQVLSRRVSGISWPYEQIPSALERVDAVLTFTSSDKYVIAAEDISSAVQKRPNKELILIDGSVPRNIDPRTAEIPGVHLYNVDDLAPFAEPQIPEFSMSHARMMIDEEVSRFFTKLRSRRAGDTLKELHQLAEEIRQTELSRAFNRMDKISSRQKEMIDVLTKRIVNKLLYEPTRRLKKRAGNGDEAFDLVIRELFAISQENN